MLKFVNCRFWRFSRFKPLWVLLCIIVHRNGNNANLGLEIAKNGYFCGISETCLFGEPFLVRFWHNPSCAWMTALNRHFLAISLFIAADLPSWRHLCTIVRICCFARNLFALCLPVVRICLICFASLHPFWSIVKCCLWFANRVFESLVCRKNPMCDLLDLRCAYVNQF